MITISLGQALLLYSGALLAGAAAIWLVTEYSTRRMYRFLGKQNLWRCFYCAYSYLDEDAEAMSECPRCHSLNTREDSSQGLATPAPSPAPAPEPQQDAPRRNPSRKHRPGARKRGPRRRR